MSDEKNLPKPEEIQKEIEEMMKDKFGDNIQIVTQAMPQFHDEMEPDEVEEIEEEDKKIDLTFDYRPKEIKDYLDRYIIGQDQAKKALSIAVCDHYNHVRECQYRRDNGIESDENYSKQNVIMLGPTGVGKTYLARTIAKLIGVPFVKADATRFTETGYVGANVDDMVRDLVAMADDNIDLAQYGIIYFDEADKLAGNSTSHGKDISGRGVQYALLKLMEETEIDLTSGNDMMSQLRAFMDFQRKGKVSKKVVNTKHILFIVSGAFSGLEDIIGKRMKLSKIGFDDDKKKHGVSDDKIFEHVTTKDFIDYGFEPEFIGRLPVRLACHDLSVDDLYQILKDSKGSIISQYIRSFKAYDIDITFEDEALKRIAELAHFEKTGARGLMTVCERLFRDYKFELPSTSIRGFMITRQLVDNPEEELKKLVAANPVE